MFCALYLAHKGRNSASFYEVPSKYSTKERVWKRSSERVCRQKFSWVEKRPSLSRNDWRLIRKKRLSLFPFRNGKTTFISEQGPLCFASVFFFPEGWKPNRTLYAQSTHLLAHIPCTLRPIPRTSRTFWVRKLWCVNWTCKVHKLDLASINNQCVDCAYRSNFTHI